MKLAWGLFSPILAWDPKTSGNGSAYKPHSLGGGCWEADRHEGFIGKDLLSAAQGELRLASVCGVL